MILLMVAFVAFQGAIFAAEASAVQGTVKSVDTAAKKIEVTTATGDSSVAYGDETKWPEGVTDPASLIGKEVKVSTDEATSAAKEVEEVKAEAAAEAAPAAPAAQ